MDAPRFTDGYDEAYDAPGESRAHYAELLSALDGLELDEVAARVQAGMDARGAGFGDRPFHVDLVPRLLTAAEGKLLGSGLEQRVRALNAFVLDAYGARRICAAGVLDATVIEQAEGYEPDLQGAWPGGPAPIGVAGLDVVRAPDGALVVLEDNVRTPSGFAYAAAAEAALRDVLPDGLAGPHSADTAFAALEAALRGAAGTGDPCVVVLTDGPQNAAAYEHATAARRLGAPLVTLADLVARDGGVALREDGRVVDVVYRRCDEDRLRERGGALTAVGALLLEPWLAGRVAIVNAFGTGIADDKLTHAYVEEMVRFYLGEEPLLASVPTLDLGTAEALDGVLAGLRDHVVKPRFGHGGIGVVVLAHADEDDVDRVTAALRETPGRFVAQRTVAISHHPTLVGGVLEPRHVDLRPFVFAADGWVHAVPGGLTRVALDEGTLVVNSSQRGGAKVTWVLE